MADCVCHCVHLQRSVKVPPKGLQGAGQGGCDGEPLETITVIMADELRSPCISDFHVSAPVLSTQCPRSHAYVHTSVHTYVHVQAPAPLT